MKLIETKLLDIDDILPNENLVRENLGEEKFEGMAKSFKKLGLIHPITVRKINGKYRLLAGTRRLLAYKRAGFKSIEAKILEVNDVEADAISLAENWHRQDLHEKEREEHVYQSWKRGTKEGIYKKVDDMYELTGIPRSNLQVIIGWGKEREDVNNTDSREIQDALAWELSRTRSLKKIVPETRKELLNQSVVKKKINSRELEDITKAIKKGSAKTSDAVLKNIPKLIAEDKLKVSQTDAFVNAITETPQELQKDIILLVEKEKLKVSDTIDFVNVISNTPTELQKDIFKTVIQDTKSPEEIKTFAKIYIESPKDIQEKLKNNEINSEEARIINNYHFPTREQREQVIAERKIMSEGIERHTNIRAKQAEEIQKKGDRENGNLTKMDMDKMRMEFYNSPEEADKRILDSYHDVMLKTKLFQVTTIQNMHTENGKKAIVEIIRNVYEHCHKILVEIGEIKIASDISPTTHKRLYG